jgi:hypothetical protein
MKRIKLIVIAFFLIFISCVAYSWAISENEVGSSAKKVVSSWENLLSQGVNLAWYSEMDDIWKVFKPIPAKGSFNYDIKKTDSTTTPYQLDISFKAAFSDNLLSPNANAILKSTQKKGGFKTSNDALVHTKPKDFEASVSANPFTENLVIHYVLQKGFWVYKDGNDKFNIYIGQDMTLKDNIHYFNELFKIPVK